MPSRDGVKRCLLQRDMAERGHSEESIKASIEARKPDFDAYIDPQKKNADVIIQVCALAVSLVSDNRHEANAEKTTLLSNHSAWLFGSHSPLSTECSLVSVSQ